VGRAAVHARQEPVLYFAITDFNAAGAYFSGAGAAEWSDLKSALDSLPLFFQASDQARKVGTPIFDPKATNAYLTTESRKKRWKGIPVPDELTPFGIHWDAGKKATLAEWQFSNYPFLWNNIIRSEAVFTGGVLLPGLQKIQALVIVTKSGIFPASNSTLYYEQAVAQVGAVTKLKTFSIPIRLVGLTIPVDASSVDVTWTEYKIPRYDRAPKKQTRRKLTVTWLKRRRKYETPNARFVIR
jgi:hypothetical protein